MFEKIGQTDMVEKICELVTIPAESTLQQAHAQCQPNSLQSYVGYLKGLYQAHRPATIVKALPPPTEKYFNLALIKKQKNEPKQDETTIRSIVQEGNVAKVLETKISITLDDLFKIDDAARKVILIEGAPGSGKSTLSWHICQKWESGDLFQQFALVVLVQLRDPAVQSTRGIATLLPCCMDEVSQEIMTKIKSQGGERVLFVMDGWDELPSNIQQESIVQQLVQPSLANPLPKSSVIVTCRSESSAQLHDIISSRVEIMGFTPSDVREYFSECLKGDSNAVGRLTEAVEQCPEIEASCYLPLNAAIIVAIFLTTLSSNLPTTLHELFTALVLTCILHHIQTRTKYKDVQTLASLDALPDIVQSSFDHLCQIAFNGVKKNKLSFSAEELGIHSGFDTLSLLQAVQEFRFGRVSVGVSHTYSFLHLSIQELLAARYISKQLLDKQAKLLDEFFDHPRFTAVFRFFAGITQLKNERIARLFLQMNEWSTHFKLGYRTFPLHVLKVMFSPSHIPIMHYTTFNYSEDRQHEVATFWYIVVLYFGKL